MFSSLKRYGTLALTVIAGAAAFSGCGLKFGERPNQDAIVQLGSSETACLSGAATTLADYFHGKASDNQVSGVFNCASNSLKLFQERTRGVRPGVYSAGELRKFFVRYFLRDFTISDAFLAELMELKKTLLGGSTSELTVDELDRLRSLLETLRDLSVRLRPYLPLTLDHVSKLKDEELESTIQALRQSADALGKILEERASPYQFSHFDRLLSEVEKFVQDDEYEHSVAELRKYLPLFISVKKIVVSPNAQEMANTDWRVLISRGAELYGDLMRLSHLLQNEPTLISGSGRVKLMSLSENVYRVLGEIVRSNPGNTISFCDMYAVIDEASKQFGFQHDLDSLKHSDFKELPAHLRIYLKNKTPQDDDDYLWYFKSGDIKIYRGTIKQLMLPLIQKYLQPEPALRSEVRSAAPLLDYLSACKPASANGSDPQISGLKPENLDRLWNIINRVSEGQLFLEKAFFYARDNFGGSDDPLVSETLPASLLGWLSTDAWESSDAFNRSLEYLYSVPTGSLSPVTKDSARVLGRMIERHLPLFRQNDARISFGDISPALPGERGRWRQSFVGLSALNAIWILTRITWDAYVTDPARIEGKEGDGQTEGISIDELRQFYQDVKEIGVAFKLFDPTSSIAADSRFLEGNLFTYASNGDSYMSLAEGTDLVAFLVSSKGLSANMYQLVRDQCAKWTVGCAPSEFSEGKSCHIGEKDVFGMDTISAECFNHFAMGEMYQQLWDHMPNLSQFFAKLPSLDGATPTDGRVYRETFSCLVETVARNKGSNSKWIASGDIDQITTLEHYLEAMFVRFDANHSGTFGRSEALAAYPVLAKVISDEVKKKAPFLKSEADFQAVLTYILARGTIPSSNDWKSILDFGIWRYIYESNFEADRARIVQVMAAITGRNVTGCFTNPNVLPNGR